MEYKFNVGDTVKVVGSGRGFAGTSIGLITTIEALGTYEGGVGYRISRAHRNSGHVNGMDTHYDGFVGERSFELVAAAATQPADIFEQMKEYRELLSKAAEAASTATAADAKASEFREGLVARLASLGLKLLEDVKEQKPAVVLTLRQVLDDGTAHEGQKFVATKTLYAEEFQEGSTYQIIHLDVDDRCLPVAMGTNTSDWIWLEDVHLDAFVLVQE